MVRLEYKAPPRGAEGGWGGRRAGGARRLFFHRGGQASGRTSWRRVLRPGPAAVPGGGVRPGV